MNKRHSYRNTVESLKAKTTKTSTGCWEWAGSRTKDGYGRTMEWPKSITTHRLMYKLFYGSIPEGKHILHKCDNPPCINPHHLWSGTHVDNMVDMTKKGRRVRLPGELNPAAKLDSHKVRKIRSLIEEGVSTEELSVQYDVCKATILHIKSRRIWNHI